MPGLPLARLIFLVVGDQRGIRPPEVVVTDAGYWNGAHIEQLVSHGIQTLVCPEAL